MNSALLHFTAWLVGFAEVFKIYFQSIDNIFFKFGEDCTLCKYGRKFF